MNLEERKKHIQSGGAQKYHEAMAKKNKLFVRERIALLLDADSEFIEDALFANASAKDLPADGVVTGLGQIDGQKVAIIANDSTVKAGSWGTKTVEKIIRMQETAEKLSLPLFYLIDSAGARITDQVEMFPGRRGAGRIFYNQVQLAGKIPQICLLFGPSAAGGAYIPAFCDVVVMVEENASMYLGSPRMAEKVIGEKVTTEEMGGARMHCTISGCGDVLVSSEKEALFFGRRYLSYSTYEKESRGVSEAAKELAQVIPENENAPLNMYDFIENLIDEASFCEIKALFAKEIITGFARLNGKSIGIVANQSIIKGGVLFPDSADKATKFIQICNAYRIPLLFLADVPGFMIGSQVEKAGIIRHGAKLIAAVSEITVPLISVIVRKAYGAGLYAMAGPGFQPDATLALPTAKIAVMGPDAAVNAVYAGKIAELPENERALFIQEKMKEYEADVDLFKLSSEMVVDDVVSPRDLRQTLITRFAFYESKREKKAQTKIYPM
ncbi:propionyl-CoA carboxylase [Listeria fleischmannii 1991]|uniref:Methylmalonyl-CoA carboxyltransferase 12S subunit n=2 Tax=Listeria fleischmannii TaxID=1069827 RepID=A0A2X3HIB9_9LIST|nr:acyl-CoA carboxylase subunit beta [Listeria fleischmannii]EMG27471.1 propionyl-CoA carboxylase [Listeria fleischmannii subsp. fleischmannii LU2006-1]KMT59715.1 propionyl-CoA carboxylase [Listeria fleischmannii 1991]SQC72313.1 Methylmalonyl-CoA carboxyltransferase 12S subunit [Listeria fleischmannii subsp. fleischmannii]